MSQPGTVDVGALWKYVTDQVKREITMPSLWRSMEAAKPLVVDEDVLVIGYSLQAADLMGLLMDTRNRNSVEQIIERATRRRIRLQVIQGDTLADWEAEKASEAEGARIQQQRRQQTTQTVAAGTNWEAVGENLIRKLGAIQNRSLSSVQGRFMAEALEEIVEAYDRLMPAEPAELDERAYTRMLDRICERVGIPSALIALMVQQRRSGA